jgi:hypothetical protein
VSVLEMNNGIGLQVFYNAKVTLGLIETKEPQEVSVPKAFADAIRILVCISVTVMVAVVSTPFKDAALKVCCAKTGKEPLNQAVCLVSLVSKKTVVARGDADAGNCP